MKKISLTLGSIIATTTPIIVVVACSPPSHKIVGKWIGTKFECGKIIYFKKYHWVQAEGRAIIGSEWETLEINEDEFNSLKNKGWEVI